MKAILLSIFLMCFGAWAQTPPPAGTATNASPTIPQLPAFRRPVRPHIATPGAGTNNVTIQPGGATTTAPAGIVQPQGANPAAAGVPGGAVAPGANPPPGGAAADGANGAKVAGGEEMVNAGMIDFVATGIDQVLDVYAQLVGRTVLRAQLPQTTITLRSQTDLTKNEAIQAFVSIFAMNGITLVNVGDKFVKAVPVNLAPTTAAPFTTNDSGQLPETDDYVTQITQLKYAKPSEVVTALTPFAQIPGNIFPIDSNNMLIIRDYASNVKRMLELLKQIDVTVPLEYDSEVIPIKYAQAQDIASALSSLGGGSGTTIGHGGSTGGGAGGLGRTGFGNTGLGGAGGYGQNGGAFGNNTGLNQPNTLGGAAGGANRTSSFGDRLNKIVQRAAQQGEFQVLGQTKIIADQRTNSLLVFASKQDMAMIKKIIKDLDIVLAQVLIEAIIMEVTIDNGRTLGVSYLQNSPSAPGNYFSGIGGINNGSFLNRGNFVNTGTNTAANVPSGFSYFANFGNDFQATLTAIATDDRIKVLSKPYVQTSHGVPASLQVGDTVPEVTGTYFGGINGAASSQYQQTFVGINLTVTPLINPDGLVVMDIMQDVEQLGPTTTIDGNPVPTTSKRTAQATVSVRDRDTIILGGMISTSKSTSHSGVPLLKDIPGIGYLFRSSIDSGKRVELIVLIKPTVLPTPEAAALVATHDRDKMPGIKAFERENRIDENKRLKESDKIKVPKELRE